jgi:hypothetical protein
MVEEEKEMTGGTGAIDQLCVAKPGCREAFVSRGCSGKSYKHPQLGTLKRVCLPQLPRQCTKPLRFEVAAEFFKKH